MRMPERWADRAGWLTLAALTLLGAGGAAAWPGGLLVGFPRALPLVLAAAALGLVALAARGSRGRLVLGFGLVPALLLAGLAVPGLRALSGPPLLALAAAGAAVLLAEARPLWAGSLFVPVIAAVYLTGAARAQHQVGPEGDEPHYLMVADSLIRDHDLALERDYSEGRYRVFHPQDLAPHYRVRGKDGAIYSLHALGLSLLVLPAYAAGGYPAASFFLALLAVFLAWELRGLLRDTIGDSATAEGVAWAVALAPPLVHYAGLVFTEIPAAVIVALALRRGRAIVGPVSAALLGAALAFLPWLNIRYAPLAAILLLYVVAGRPRLRVALALLAPLAVSAAALAAYHQALYGFMDPRRVYGSRPELSLSLLAEGLQGLLLDQEFGLLVYAPLFVLAAPGLLRLARSRPRLALTALAMAGAVLLTAGSWPMWRGGFNPPARFLVPVVPALALGVAAWVARGFSPAAALLMGWGVWTGLAGVAEPRLAHRDRDGTAPLFRAVSGAEEWTRLLPGYVLEDADRHRLACLWVLALVAAGVPRRRNVLAGVGAVTVLGAAAVAASLLSTARTEGRDAVRLIGRPALELPTWRWLAATSGRWGPTELTWGPVYEPHRHPDGAVIGGRLALPPGSYRLEVVAEDLAPAATAPELETAPEPDRGAGQKWRLARTSGGLAGTFVVAAGDRAVSLRLRGGGPWAVSGINLLSGGRSK